MCAQVHNYCKGLVQEHSIWVIVCLCVYIIILGNGYIQWNIRPSATDTLVSSQATLKNRGSLGTRLQTLLTP